MLFIVVWDDECGCCYPMGVDDECEGAICAVGESEAVAVFGTRQAARKAIVISRLFAQLKNAQGKPHNAEFVEGSKCLRIRKAEIA